MKDVEAPEDRLLAVAVGCPGVVDYARGVVGFAPNLSGWSNVSVRDILERALEAPVVVENDTNLAVLGEHWRGAARGHDTCVFMFVGTGIGAGVLIDGELHRGHHFMAGEIAVMCMGPQYVDVDFGSRGCLETLAGLQSFAARWPRSGRAIPRAGWPTSSRPRRAGTAPPGRRWTRRRASSGSPSSTSARWWTRPSSCSGARSSRRRSRWSRGAQGGGADLARALEIVVSALGKEAPLWGSLLWPRREARTPAPPAARARRGSRVMR